MLLTKLLCLKRNVGWLVAQRPIQHTVGHFVDD